MNSPSIGLMCMQNRVVPQAYLKIILTKCGGVKMILLHRVGK